MNLPNNSVSHSFKVAMAVLLFSLTFAKIILLSYFPDAEILPDRALLITVLAIVSYFWVQELKDYNRLLRLNKELITTQEQLKDAEIDTIAALIKAEEEKDLYTRGHSERVTEIALAIAENDVLPETRRIKAIDVSISTVATAESMRYLNEPSSDSRLFG